MTPTTPDASQDDLQALHRAVFGGILASIGETVKTSLEGRYGSETRLSRIIDSELSKRDDVLRSIIGDALDQAFADDFKVKLREAAAHKLARVLISKCEGEIEKRANDMRSDPAFRARLTLAIDAAIKGVDRP